MKIDIGFTLSQYASNSTNRRATKLYSADLFLNGRSFTVIDGNNRKYKIYYIDKNGYDLTFTTFYKYDKLIRQISYYHKDVLFIDNYNRGYHISMTLCYSNKADIYKFLIDWNNHRYEITRNRDNRNVYKYSYNSHIKYEDDNSTKYNIMVAYYHFIKNKIHNI